MEYSVRVDAWAQRAAGAPPRSRQRRPHDLRLGGAARGTGEQENEVLHRLKSVRKAQTKLFMKHLEFELKHGMPMPKGEEEVLESSESFKRSLFEPVVEASEAEDAALADLADRLHALASQVSRVNTAIDRQCGSGSGSGGGMERGAAVPPR